MVGFLIPGVRTSVISGFMADCPAFADTFTYSVKAPVSGPDDGPHTGIVVYTYPDAFAAWLIRAGIPYYIVPASPLLPEEAGRA